MALLSTPDLSHHYAHDGFSGEYRHQTVLNNVPLALESGETVTLLERSDCGENTLARLLVRLESSLRGNISWCDEPLTKLDRAQCKTFRHDVRMMFRGSISAVNPRKTVCGVLRELMRHLLSLERVEQLTHVSETPGAVDLDDSVLGKYPPQLGDSQLQRICLVRALAVESRLLVPDGAVSNFDLMLRAGIIRLLKKLQQRFNTVCLFIIHDLYLVERFCQRAMMIDSG